MFSREWHVPSVMELRVYRRGPGVFEAVQGPSRWTCRRRDRAERRDTSTLAGAARARSVACERVAVGTACAHAVLPVLRPVRARAGAHPAGRRRRRLAGADAQYLLKVFPHPILSAVGRQQPHPVDRSAAWSDAVVGTAIGYAITAIAPRARPATSIRARQPDVGLGGRGLAFAFIILLGASGAITIALRSGGLRPVLGVLAVLAARADHRLLLLPDPADGRAHAARYSRAQAGMARGNDVAGRHGRDFWRRVGIPVLAPAIVSSFILMFASGMGAYATAAALVASPT